MSTLLHKVNSDNALADLPLRTDDVEHCTIVEPVTCTPALVGAICAVVGAVGAGFFVGHAAAEAAQG